MSYPMFHSHVLGHVVRTLREMVIRGERANAILGYLRDRCGTNDHLPFEYLRETFVQDNWFFFVIGPGVSRFGNLDAKTERMVQARLIEHRDRWEKQRFPELPRVRDYFAFLEFARDERVTVTACDVPPGTEEYRLHGVYDADSGEPVWSGKRGEKLRGALNRRLGAELVRRGPHDDWEHRNDRDVAGSLWGPQAPAIAFDHQGGITNLLTLRDLARHQPRWDQLYPHHPIPEAPDDDR